MSNSAKAYIERQDRMLDALASKLKTNIGHRADMYVEDVEAIDRDSCRVLVAYAKHIGPLTTEDLEQFVIREFSGKVLPELTTAQSFSDMGRVMCVLTRTQVTRPMEDAKHMKTIAAGAVYIDQTLSDTWEVEHPQGGEPYLRRVSADNISQIVEVRRQRMASASHPMTIATAMSTYGGVAAVGPGDVVKVVYKDSVHADCTVSSVGDDKITVKIPNVGSCTLAKQAVVQIQQISAKRLAQMENSLKEYYSDIYGPEYAKLMTDDTTQG